MRRSGYLGRMYLNFFKPVVAVVITVGWLVGISGALLVPRLLDLPAERALPLAMILVTVLLTAQGALGLSVLVSPRAQAMLVRSPQKIAASRSLFVALIAVNFITAALLIFVVSDFG